MISPLAQPGRNARLLVREESYSQSSEGMTFDYESMANTRSMRTGERGLALGETSQGAVATAGLKSARRKLQRPDICLLDEPNAPKRPIQFGDVRSC